MQYATAVGSKVAKKRHNNIVHVVQQNKASTTRHMGKTQQQ